MIVRSYQQKCVDALLASWKQFTRLLGIALTGSGQPIMFAEICPPRLEFGRQNQQPAFVAALRRSAPRTDKELRRLRRRLTARITHRHGQLLGLVAKKAAVETELARRGFLT
jgi:hypothetical protein